MEIHYGATVRDPMTKALYLVRAIAPGVCVVLGDVLFDIGGPCPMDHLYIVHPDELDENFELVKA